MRRAVLAALMLAASVSIAAPTRPMRMAAATRAAAGPDVRGVAEVQPARAHLGDPLRYHGQVIVNPGVRVRWSPPRSDSLWTWGAPRAWHRAGEEGTASRGVAVADTIHIEVPLQAWETGVLTVPGIAFEIGPPGSATRARLPALRITIENVIPATDTSAQLHPLRGPLPAPWWEKVPWRWVIAGLLLLVAVILAWRWLARRRPAGRPVAPGLTPSLDPVARALAELDSLRGLNLPEQGRFGEHAFHLTRISRQFLESVAGTPRPGDSTPELIARLPGAGLGPEDQGTLATLLRSWDMLKFARVGSSVEEARRAESLLESFVKRWSEARAAAESRVA